MVRVFVSLAELLFRFFVEGLLAAERAEVISLAFILRFAGGGGGIDIHAAYGVVYCICHSCSFSLDYASFVRLIEAQRGV